MLREIAEPLTIPPVPVPVPSVPRFAMRGPSWKFPIQIGEADEVGVIVAGTTVSVRRERLKQYRARFYKQTRADRRDE